MNISSFPLLMVLLVAIPNSRGIKEDTEYEYHLETIPKLRPGPRSMPPETTLPMPTTPPMPTPPEPTTTLGPETTTTPRPVTTTTPRPVTTNTPEPVTTIPDYSTTSPDPETTPPDYSTTTPEPGTTTTSEPEPQCNINVKCKGSVISYSFTNDQTECLNQCKHYFPTPYQSSCKWITFDADTGLCELFEDCSPTDPGDCSNCITSEVRCETETDPICYVPGNCQGNIIDFSHNIPSIRYCMEVCNGSDFGCNWISYSQEKQLCMYLETCTLDKTNEDFISAHASCGAPPITKLLIMGGTIDDQGIVPPKRHVQREETTEVPTDPTTDAPTPAPTDAPTTEPPTMVETKIIDLLNPSNDCSLNIDDLDESSMLAMEDGTGGLIFNQIPYICGGTVCIGIEQFNITTQDLQYPRNGAASTFANSSIFISGGTMSSDSTELVSDNGSESGPDLPEPLSNHCMVTLDFRGPNEQVWVIGGKTTEGSSYKTYILGGGSDWESGPDLIYKRQEHACAATKSKAYGNQEIIVVAGGRDEMFGDIATNSVEFHISGSEYWFRGPVLPQAMRLHSMVAVPDLDSVITVGGLIDSETAIDDLYELTCQPDDCVWNKKEQTLKNARYNMVATIVPDELITCQERKLPK